jgi:4-amino-4-deoxy-L-arabinose transferase-like glycosyltransferase
MLLFAAIAVPWYVVMSLANDDYLSSFVRRHLVDFLAAEARHPQPWYYHLAVLGAGLVPWTLFLPVAFLRRRGRAHAFLAVWCGAMLLFFSAARSKLPTYILPVFPAAALSVALFWTDVLQEPTARRGRIVLIALVPLLLVTLGAAVYLVLWPPVRLHERDGLDLCHLLLMTLLASGWLVLAGALAYGRRLRACFAAIIAGAASVVMFAEVVVLPDIDHHRSARTVARQVDRLTPPGEPLVFLYGLKKSALFYTNRTGRVLERPGELNAYLASDSRVFCILDWTDAEVLERVDVPYHVVDRQGNLIVISNREE